MLRKIPLIDLDAGIMEQLPVFFLKGHLSMVLLLPLQIRDEFRLVAKGKCECPISLLPAYKIGEHLGILSLLRSP